MKLYRYCLNKHIGKIYINKEIKAFISVKTGGMASYVILPKNKSALIRLLNYIRGKIPYIIIGNGTNVLALDKPFYGVLIVLNKMDVKYRIKKNNIYITSSVSSHFLSYYFLKNNYKTFKGLFGIPGLLGGALVNNSNNSFEPVYEYLNFIDVYMGKKMRINAKDIKLGYRYSSISGVILGASFKLVRANAHDYNEAISYLAKKKIAQPLNARTFGSIYKNPRSHKAFELIKRASINLNFPKEIFSKKHYNFIDNQNNYGSDLLLNYLSKIEEWVYQNEKIKLEREFKIIP